MSTLIVNWKKNCSNFITVGLNRDDKNESSFEEFSDRNGVFCPLDGCGGTWIGVNKFGIFSALTNRHICPHKNNVETKGNIVLEALNTTSVKQALSEVAKLDYELYNPFNLIIGDKTNLYCIINKENGLLIKKLKQGLHVVTADWEINDWDSFRCSYIADNFNNDPNIIRDILSYTDECSEKSVYINDENNKTVSSCIINGYCKVLDDGYSIFEKFCINHTYDNPSEDKWKYDEFCGEFTG